LQRIKEFLFTDVGERKTDLVLCENHSQEIQSNLHLDSHKRPIVCYKIENDLESPDDLEELRNLDIKEIEERREIHNTIPRKTGSSYNYPLKL